MNKIIDVKVDLYTGSNQRPTVFCLFDSIETDHLIFDMAGAGCSNEFRSKSILVQKTDLSGFNLLSIDNDLVVWYYYSAVNADTYFTPYQNVTLKIRQESQVIERTFSGLWGNNSEAINFWFPQTLVMEVRGSKSREEFETTLGFPMGAVADPVTRMLKSQGWRAGLVSGQDGYVNVEPLLPDGSPKSHRSKVLYPL